MKKPTIAFLVLVLILFVSCAKQTPTTTVVPETFGYQKQIKLTFKPDPGKYILTDEDISMLYNKADLTGKQLKYEIKSINHETGRTSLYKQSIQGYMNVQADINVIRKNESIADVYITMFGHSQKIVDIEMTRFIKHYKSMFK